MSNSSLATAPPAVSDAAGPAPRLDPTARAERVPTLDILRGFALFGILLVNLELFFGSYYAYIMGDMPASTADLWAKRAVQFFAEGKFYSIFAFLFGAGIALFMQRAEAKGVRFVPVYSRRLFVLLLFGLVHAFLIWTGDILILYSLLGFVVILLFRNRRPRTLLIWAGICLAIPIVVNAGLVGLMAAGTAAIGPEAMAEATAGAMVGYEVSQVQADAAYSSGNWLEVTAQRTRDMGTVLTLLPFIAFNVLAMMLAGFAAAKAGIHTRLNELRPQLRRAMWWGLIIGVIGNAIYVAFSAAGGRADASAATLLATTGQTIGAPALALFYMAGITLLTLQPPGSVRALPLAAAGRMAITNYLAQSLIMTTLAYGYGFGLYGLGNIWFIPLALALWLLQLAWSTWWLNRFQFGPVEWLWRVLTYMRPEPMRLPRPAKPKAQTA